MKMKIVIDTQSAVARLVGLATGIEDEIILTDGAGMRVSAKSLLGATYAAFDFSEIWLESKQDHYTLFKDFVAE